MKNKRIILIKHFISNAEEKESLKKLITDLNYKIKSLDLSGITFNDISYLGEILQSLASNKTIEMYFFIV